MNAAWDLEMPSGMKFVLMSLCDQANDAGQCFPSVATIAKRCSMSERAVQGHVKALEEAGFLARRERVGHSTLYCLDPRRICTPADSAPPQNLRLNPADSAPTPPQILRGTPADSAPITTTEPSIEPKGNHQKVALAQPDGVPDQVWADFLSLRKAKKAPLTSTALEGIAREAAKAGRTLGDVLALCCTRGWQGFRADWLTDTKSASATRPAKFDPVAFVNGRKEDAHVVIDVPAQRVA